jgi:hypothetical protein
MNRKIRYLLWEDRQTPQRTGELPENRASDLPELLDATHSTPIKLNTGANPVDTRAKDQDVRCPKVEVMGVAPVCQVQVICLGWPLSCNCVNLFHRWADPQFLTQLPNSQLCAKGRERPDVGMEYRLT